jgi:hypothetical protein
METQGAETRPATTGGNARTQSRRSSTEEKNLPDNLIVRKDSAMPNDSDYTYKILKVFRVDKEEDDKYNAIELIAIIWTRCGQPVLEKRRVYYCKSGEKRLRKQVGMNAADIQLILDNAEEIRQLLKPIITA